MRLALQGKEIVQGINNYYKYMREIEKAFIGLPHASLLIVKSLIALAEPSTGSVNNITYNQLAQLLTVHQAPGRKNSGTPTKQTIRNYIRSIETSCSNHFKVITEGQKLRFLFPELPNIFNKIFNDIGVNTESTSDEFVENTEQNTFIESEGSIEVNTEENTPPSTVKNIIFNNINNNNNNKQSISNNFTPNAETISRAQALGYSNAEDPTEIQNFIEYNKACGAQWADFNPIYLRWLAQSQERQQQRNQMNNTRSFNHENKHRNKTKTNTASARERVIQAYANQFAFCEETRRFNSKTEQEQRIYCDFVAAIN
ncbi:hypothetical protein ACD661_15590 [Legionella lytica]|uniref:Legionella vir region protein LvrA n=1 Tax=Legionella lytica TaxID=96232 RepID=A0ABW8DDR8_9GAMM